MKKPVVKKASEINRPKAWAIYGRAGTGKTTLAGSFPKPALLIDVSDYGTDSVRDVEDLDVIEVSKYEEIDQIYWWLQKKKYKTVIIDTMTQVQTLLVEDYCEANAAKGAMKAMRAKRLAGDFGTLTKSQWGDIAAELKGLVTRWRNLPMEVVFLAQDRVFNDGDEDESMLDPEVGPRLSPSVKSHLCAAVHIIGTTFIRKKKKKVQYCLRLGPNESHITKFRKPKGVSLPDVLTDPSYEGITQAIRGETNHGEKKERRKGRLVKSRSAVRSKLRVSRKSR